MYKRVRQGPWKLVCVISHLIMPPFISNDLKAHMPALHYEQGFSVKSILNVRKIMAYETLHHHCIHGVAFNINGQQQGVQCCALTSVDLAFI